MLELLSPCKLNLFLYVTGRRSDGYHNLQTLFVIMNHGDKMRFTPREDGQIKLHGQFDFPDQDNLIVKAALKLQQAYACPMGADIFIDKILPQGGGLGGGSSNAATTLLALNHLWQLQAAQSELMQLGAALGADVPVFILGTGAFAEGIGDKLRSCPIPERWYLVCTPPCAVPTKEIFSDPDLKRDSPVRSLKDLMSQPFGNDLTACVTKKYSQVGQTLARLVKYGAAQMSGSGSSCFVEFSTQEKALQAQQDLGLGWGRTFVARAVSISPVLSALHRL